MKSILMTAALMMTITASAQGTVEATAPAATASTSKAAAKMTAKKAKKASKKATQKGALLEKSEKEAPIALPAKSVESTAAPAATDATSSGAAVSNQSTTSVAEVKPTVAKKWGAEAAFVSDSDAKLAFQDGKQHIIGYAAIKYKADKQNAFAIRQYGELNTTGGDSKPTDVSTGRALNTMLVYNRMLGKLLAADEEGTLLQTRLTLPTNDNSKFNVAALSATLVLPYTINPKWSAEYGIRLGTSFSNDNSKQVVSLPVNYAQITYGVTDKFQLFQQLAVTSGDIRFADQLALEPSTGVMYMPVSAVYMDFSINQSHGIGAAATQYKLYDVAESKYGATLMFIY